MSRIRKAMKRMLTKSNISFPELRQQTESSLTFVKKERQREIGLLSVFLALFIFAIFFMTPSFTGFIAGEQTDYYTDNISIALDKTGQFTWSPDPTLVGELSSIRISGRVIGNGTAKVYFEDKLIYEAKAETETGAGLITGMLVNVPASEETTAQPGDNGTGLPEEMVIDGAEPTEEQVISLENTTDTTYSEPGANDTFIEQETTTNLSEANETLLSISENISAPQESEQVENQTTPLPAEPESSQAIEEVPEEEIIPVEPELLVREINNDCIDTCLISGYNSTGYTIRVELENARLEIDSIDFTMKLSIPGSEPVFVPGEDISLYEGLSKTINLSDYFTDPEGDTLTYLVVPGDNLVTYVEYDLLTIIPSQGFIGESTITIYASDGSSTTISPTINVFVRSRESDPLDQVLPFPEIYLQSGSNYTLNLNDYFSSEFYGSLTYSIIRSENVISLLEENTLTLLAPDNFIGKGYVNISIEDINNKTLTAIVPVKLGNTEPTQVKPFGLMQAHPGMNYHLSLNEYFTDEDGDSLIYLVQPGNFIPAVINGDFLTITIPTDFLGEDEFLISITDGFSSPTTYSLHIISTNEPPVQLAEIPDDTMYVNSNLSIYVDEYFTDADGDPLTYSIENAHLTLVPYPGYIVLIPEKDFIGNLSLRLSVEDVLNKTISNEFVIRIMPLPGNSTYNMDTPVPQTVIIGQPVKWSKRIVVYNQANYTNDIPITVEVPLSAENISVLDLSNKKEIEKDKISVPHLKKTLKQLDEEGAETPADGLNLVTGNLALLSGGNGLFTRLINWFAEGGITGKLIDVPAIGEETTGDSAYPTTELLFTESFVEKESKEYVVEYYTDGPSVNESDEFGKKTIQVSSDIAYKDILTYTEIDELPQDSIRLYWLASKEDYIAYFLDNITPEEPLDDITYRMDITNNPLFGVNFQDTNENGLIDRLEWVTPHLSDQTFEIELTVLNPYTYLIDNESWTVYFNTSGTANLTISSPNANWTELLLDSNETFDEMMLEDIVCGNTSLKSSLKIITADDSVYDYASLAENDSIKPEKYFLSDYNCDNQTSYIKNYMIKAGYSTLLFEYSNQYYTISDYAYDPEPFYITLASYTPTGTVVDTTGCEMINNSLAGYTCVGGGNPTLVGSFTTPYCSVEGDYYLRVNTSESDGDYLTCGSSCAYNVPPGSWADVSPGDYNESSRKTHTILWDGSEANCTCKMGGSGYWNLGGETAATTCCGDDANEYALSRKGATYSLGPSFTNSTSDDACCLASTDCVNGSTCYNAGNITFDVDANGEYDFCNNSVWYDCNTSAQCQAGATCVNKNCVGTLGVTLNLNDTSVRPDAIIRISGHVNDSDGWNASNAPLSIYLNGTLLTEKNLTELTVLTQLDVTNLNFESGGALTGFTVHDGDWAETQNGCDSGSTYCANVTGVYDKANLTYEVDLYGYDACYINWRYYKESLDSTAEEVNFKVDTTEVWEINYTTAPNAQWVSGPLTAQRVTSALNVTFNDQNWINLTGFIPGLPLPIELNFRMMASGAADYFRVDNINLTCLKVNSPTTDANGNYNYTFKVPSADGVYIVRVNATFDGEIGEKNATLIVADVPDINSHTEVPTRTFWNSPTYGTPVYITANVTGTNLIAVNFTLTAPNGTNVISNRNATSHIGDIWNSSSFSLNAYGQWSYTVAAIGSNGYNKTETGTINFLQVTLGSLVVRPSADMSIAGHLNDSQWNDVANSSIELYVDGTNLESTIRWQKNFTSSGSFSDTLYGLAVDASGNIYAVGAGENLSGVSTGQDWWIKKFSSDGVEDTVGWNWTFNSLTDDQAKAVAIGSKGDIYVFGQGAYLSGLGAGLDWWIKKFSPDGVEDIINWNKTFSGGVSGNDDRATDMAVDSDGNIYLFGYGENLCGYGTTSDFWIKKFDDDGVEDTVNWNKTISSAGNRNDFAQGIAIDSQNNVYVVGNGYNVSGSSTSGDWWIMKFSSDGVEDTVNWNKNYTGVGSDAALDVAIDSQDNVYVVGYGSSYLTATSLDDWLIKKFSSDGVEDTVNWNKTFGTAGNDRPRQVMIGPGDSVYVAGYGENLSGATGPDWWIKKFSSDGVEDTTEWNLSFTSYNNGDEQVFALSRSLDDNMIYVGGRGINTTNINTDEDWWLISLYSPATDANGNYNYTLTAPASSGTYIVKVNATYNGEYGEKNTTLIVNTAPTIQLLNISPVYPNSTANLNCNLTAVDSDNSTLNVEFTWYNSSTPKYWGNTTATSGTNKVISTLGTANTTRGESWSCYARVSDIQGYWTDYTSSTVTILNTPPEIAWATTTSVPTGYYDNGILLGWCNAADADLDNVSYSWKWFKNNTLNSSGTESPLNHTQGTTVNVANITTGLVAGQNWTLECKAYDGTNYSTALNSTMITIQQSNTAPNITGPRISPTSPNVTTDLQCNATATDAQSTTLTVEYIWYNSSTPKYWGNTTVQNNTNSIINTLSHTLIHKGETWNCTVRVNDSTLYSVYNSSKVTIANSIPYKVNLSYPADKDYTFTNRTPRFNWSITPDADGDTVTYHLEVSLTSTFTDQSINVSGITNNYYAPTDELNVYATYWWRVHASDGTADGSFSDTWNFTIVGSPSIKLVNDTVHFGNLQIGASNDTSNNNPLPFYIENDGNIEVNISVNGSALWQSTSAPLGTSYYQYKANSTSEGTAYNTTYSQTSWQNMTATLTRFAVKLNHSDTKDLMALDIRVVVPLDEPAVLKNSSLVFLAVETR